MHRLVSQQRHGERIRKRTSCEDTSTACSCSRRILSASVALSSSDEMCSRSSSLSFDVSVTEPTKRCSSSELSSGCMLSWDQVPVDQRNST